MVEHEAEFRTYTILDDLEAARSHVRDADVPEYTTLHYGGVPVRCRIPWVNFYPPTDWVMQWSDCPRVTICFSRQIQ